MKIRTVLLEKMPKKAKKDFLSNDLAERIIRIEQRVSAKFGKFIPYKQTEYYESMNREQRRKFEKYLRNKKRKKALALSLVFISLLLFGLFNIQFTGNFMRETFGEVSFVNSAVLIVTGVGFVLIVYSFLSRLRRKRLNETFKHFESVVFRR